MPTKKEVFATNVVECRGKTATCSKVDFQDALERPVQVLITTFRDGTRTVCCPHLGRSLGDTKGCRAGEPQGGIVEANSRKKPSYPFCAYYFDKKELKE